jgi:hypothetical protein
VNYQLPFFEATSKAGADLTLRLSDTGLRRLKTKPLYPNHRLPPALIEDATRVRSNRLLDGSAAMRELEMGDTRP